MGAEESKVESIFYAALDRESAAERGAYLDAACAGDPELRSRVEHLLEAEPKLARFLENGAADNAATIDPPAVEQPGSWIGPYKLVEEIGEGGMGSVFMALQKTPVRRKVALKIIKPGMDSKQVVSRFEAERQALALMDHPNIARVFDGGATQSGRPYFVMELVKGIPITEYCDGHRLTNKERLELFRDVCSAVHHAHQKGIIHRDLKPSNVLVTQLDGKPLPKIIDFGIAKATSGHLMDESFVTGFSQFVGTPMYMSPEQAELTAADIDTRSDVYSLGVLLYELLTGTTPFDRDRLSSVSFDEVRRIVREEDPPRPSTRLSTVDAALETVAEKRHTDPRSLSHEVRGELDWIVMKALEKDRTRRYETANDLARDIQRYLNDEAVEACPPSRIYRFRKFARRNRAALMSAAAILVSVLVLLVSTTLVAIGQREHAQRRLAVQEGIADALTEVARLRGPGQENTLDDDAALFRAREQLQRALAFAASGPADENLVAQVQELSDQLDQQQRDRQLLAALDKAWLAKRDLNAKRDRLVPERSIRLLHEALTGYGLKIGGDAPLDVAAQIARRPEAIRQELIAALYEWYVLSLPPIGVAWRHVDGATQVGWVSSLGAAGRDGRLKSGDQLVGVGQDSQSPIADTRAMTLAEIATLLRGEPGSTVRLKVIPQDESEPRVYEIQRNPTAGWLKIVIEAADPDPWRRRLWEASRMRDETQRRAALEKLADEADIERQPVRMLTRLASDLAGPEQDYWKNPGALEKPLAFLRRVRQKHPGDLEANVSLAAMLFLSKPPQLEEAVRYYTVATALRPDNAGFHDNLGATLSYQGKLEEAIAECREAIRLQPNSGTVHYNLGVYLSSQGNLDEAIAHYREAIRLQPGDVDSRNNLGLAWLQQGKLEEAITELREAIRLRPDCVEAHCSLGKALRNQGRWEEAIAEYREAIRLQPDSVYAHNNLGNALAQQDKLDEATAEYAKVIQLQPDHVEAHSNLGNVLVQQGRLDEGIAHYREAIRLRPEFVDAHINLGAAFARQDKSEEAVAEYREALRLRPEYAVAHKNLGIALKAQGRVGEAIAEFRETIRLQPDYVEALFHLGVALAEQGKLDESIVQFREVIRLRPGVASAHKNLGSALKDQGKLAEAIAEYREAVRLNAQDTSAQEELSRLLEQAKADQQPKATEKSDLLNQ